MAGGRPIYKQLKRARSLRGITQRELAELAGVHQSQVCRYERGKTDVMSDELVVKLGEVLSVSVSPEDLAAERLGQKERAAFRMLFCFCANLACPSITLVRIDARIVAVPTLLPPDVHQGALFCDLCGQELKACCPSCGKSVRARIHCGFCGDPLVEVSDMDLAELEGVQVVESSAVAIQGAQQDMQRWNEMFFNGFLGQGRNEQTNGGDV